MWICCLGVAVRGRSLITIADITDYCRCRLLPMPTIADKKKLRKLDEFP
ncbi:MULTISPECIES: hypothetical protein [Planktothricoides]|uniref:Uncharacterized protein n=2 Tax=Planktothricoides raciborskii TaxID=132608 RepID=A0AAU8JF65_9CYAN|nr:MULTISPECIES: hypothetical protein [Planktothricoides]MBD2547190.1 hypothetical protein [Planktothricoides raciborskii FACHB-1370]MBD2585391.1 hypothetical protein [Planktothricoides raciborskii FACHB-1261]